MKLPTINKKILDAPFVHCFWKDINSSAIWTSLKEAKLIRPYTKVCRIIGNEDLPVLKGVSISGILLSKAAHNILSKSGTVK